jgi:mRNA interferase RelE/StbE
MELIAKGSFYRDVAKLSNRKLIQALSDMLGRMEKANSISEIPNLKKLKNFSVYYRTKIAGDYRMGMVIRGNKIWLVCFGHRSNFYKSFP